MSTSARPRPVAPTGIPGLDDVLSGGLTKNRIYLVQGDPGVGKTTLGLQFLLEGARRGMSDRSQITPEGLSCVVPCLVVRGAKVRATSM